MLLFENVVPGREIAARCKLVWHIKFDHPCGLLGVVGRTIINDNEFNNVILGLEARQHGLANCRLFVKGGNDDADQ